MLIAKRIALVLLWIIGYLNQIVPKFNVIMFFTNNKDSNDNNRALLEKTIEFKLYEKYKIYYFSKDSRKYRHYDEVHYRSTLLAPLYFLFSKYCFYDCGTLKIKPNSAQHVISLWHGIPLKKIGLMCNEQISAFDRYDDFSKILVPSEKWVDVYKKSFGCSQDQIFINGFPRNDFLLENNKDTLTKLKISSKYSHYFLWMPTFRTSINGRYIDTKKSKWDLPIFSNTSQLKEFNEKLKNNNIGLIIKLHPYSILNINTPESFSNIVFVKNAELNKLGIINYKFVSCFDALITDYSSIFFDFLLTQKPIGFTIDDLKEYSIGRGFNVPNPEKYLVGPQIKNKSDLFEFILKITKGDDPFKEERKELASIAHQYSDNKSTERLLKHVGLL